MSSRAATKLAPALALALLAAASSAAQKGGAAGARLEVGGVSFAAPEGFELLKPGAGDTPLFFRHKQDELIVFVAAAPGEGDLMPFLRGLVDSSAARLYPEEQKFEWHGALGMPRISEHESGVGGALAYNERLVLLATHHRISFDGKDVWIGFLAKFNGGREVAQANVRPPGGGSVPGCRALVGLAASITGEKVADGGDRCTKVVGHFE